MDLFKCVAYMFCFSIASSYFSISICKDFAMFSCAIKNCYKSTTFFYTQPLFHYFEADVLGYETTEFTEFSLLIPYRLKWDGLLSGQLNTFTYL